MRDERQVPANLPDDGLIRRVKALACTAPLQALDANKGSLDWVNADGYHMAEVALHTIDQVTVAMDFDAGADHDQVVDQVKRFVAVQAPLREDQEHRAVAEWVLNKLINIGTLDRGFTWTYGRIGADGLYHHYDFDFKLIVERSANGRIGLRTTDEAINVLVGALDTDVESAQIAAEYKLDNLIKRGRLEDAKLAAEQARYRTVQYGEALRQYLEATRRDVRTVDWEHRVPDLLEDALYHIEGRYQAENAILSNITEHRDNTEDIRRKRQAAELVDIVRDCIRRHMQLQNHLQSAGALFRSEQDRQQFSEPLQRAALDLHGQLLVPVLGLTVRDAQSPVANLFRASVAPTPPAVLSLASLVGRLLQPSLSQNPFAGDVPIPVLENAEETKRFTDDDWRVSEELLAVWEEPQRLSAVLTRASRHSSDVERLVLHRAAHAFSPALSEAILRRDQSVLLALPTGEAIDTPDLAGDELLLYRARLERPEDPAHEQGTKMRGLPE